jgi:hypothetical protein
VKLCMIVSVVPLLEPPRAPPESKVTPPPVAPAVPKDVAHIQLGNVSPALNPKHNLPLRLRSTEGYVCSRFLAGSRWPQIELESS